MKNRVISVLLSLVLALFAISSAIAVPIVCRPFYYLHIKALNLPEQTGWSAEEIVEYYYGGAEVTTASAPAPQG